MHIAIVGAGGIGGFLAAHLAPTHHGVHLIARGAHVRLGDQSDVSVPVSRVLYELLVPRSAQ